MNNETRQLQVIVHLITDESQSDDAIIQNKVKLVICQVSGMCIQLQIRKQRLYCHCVGGKQCNEVLHANETLQIIHKIFDWKRVTVAELLTGLREICMHGSNSYHNLFTLLHRNFNYHVPIHYISHPRALCSYMHV